MLGSIHNDGVLRLMILVKMMLVNLKEAAIEVCNVDDTTARLITTHLRLVPINPVFFCSNKPSLKYLDKVLSGKSQIVL